MLVALVVAKLVAVVLDREAPAEVATAIVVAAELEAAVRMLADRGPCLLAATSGYYGRHESEGC